jgi:hypothetical protein
MATKTARKPRFKVLVGLRSERLPPFASDAELADWLGVDRSQLSRYRRGHQRPGSDVGWRLTGLQAVVVALRQVLETDAVADWLLGVNTHLNHQRPLDLLREGRVAEVMHAVEAERTGSFA